MIADLTRAERLWAMLILGALGLVGLAMAIGGNDRNGRQLRLELQRDGVGFLAADRSPAHDRRHGGTS